MDDICNIEKIYNIPQVCTEAQYRREYNEVPNSKMFVSDMVTSDGGRLSTSIGTARKWITSMARAAQGNDTVGIPDGGDVTQLRIDFNNWCCLSAEESTVIAGVLTNLIWNKITVKVNQAGCVKVYQPDSSPLPQTVTIGAFVDPASNAQLLTLVQSIEQLVATARSGAAAIPIVSPRKVPFYIALATVHMGIFPVADALKYLVASSTTDATDQSFGTAVVQAISFNGQLYYSTDAYIAPATADCPDCNTSASTMIAAVLCFLCGAAIFYGCYYYREKIKSVSHRATEMARKALKPHGQTDSDA